MCLDFDGHQSGGSSFDLYIIFGFYDNMWAIPTGTNSVLKKKKDQVKSPSIWSRTPNSVRIRQSGRTGIRSVIISPGRCFVGIAGLNTSS